MQNTKPRHKDDVFIETSNGQDHYKSLSGYYVVNKAPDQIGARVRLYLNSSLRLLCGVLMKPLQIVRYRWLEQYHQCLENDRTVK